MSKRKITRGRGRWVCLRRLADLWPDHRCMLGHLWVWENRWARKLASTSAIRLSLTSRSRPSSGTRPRTRVESFQTRARRSRSQIARTRCSSRTLTRPTSSIAWPPRTVTSSRRAGKPAASQKSPSPHSKSSTKYAAFRPRCPPGRRTSKTQSMSSCLPPSKPTRR